MNGIEGFVIAVNDLGIGGVPAPVVVGHVAVLVLHAAGGRGVVLLRLTGRNGTVHTCQHA